MFAPPTAIYAHSPGLREETPLIMPLFHCERDGLLREELLYTEACLREGLLYTEACLRQILQRLNILFGEDRDLH